MVSNIGPTCLLNFLSASEYWPCQEAGNAGRYHEHGFLEPPPPEEHKAYQTNSGRWDVEDRPLSEDHDRPGDGATGGRRCPSGERL